MLTLTIYHIVVIILFIISFVAFVFITRGRRPISNVLAWLFFMFLLPYVGIPLFLILGQRKLNWILKKKRLTQQPINDTHADIPIEHLLNSSHVMPPTENNSMQLLDPGIVAYNAIVKHIQDAKHSVLISTYLLHNDKVGCTIVELLTEKARQGVQVCLLLDTIGSLLKFPRSKLRPLKKAGGLVRYIMPLFHTPFRGRVNLRDHRKIMIFDGKTAIMGGMNLAIEYLGPLPDPKRWIDLNILLKGGAVKDLLSVYESDWKFSASNMEQKTYQHPQLSSSCPGNALMQIVASGPDMITDVLYDAVISSIYNASKSIYIVTPYFILDDALQKAFMIAVRRGVDVNIILPRHSNHKIADLIRSINIRKLHDEGAHIWFYPKMIHAKTMLFDEELAIVGSANFDLRSLLLNFEISCFIYSKTQIELVQNWVNALLPTCSSKFYKPSLVRMWIEDAAQLIKPLV